MSTVDPAGGARAQQLAATRARILDVAREVLGDDPDAGMSEVAAAAGVVRRTVYGHFPARADLVRTITLQAVDEIVAVVREVDHADEDADAIWAGFVARLWPLTARYRVLIALRRGEYGEEIHAMLAPVDALLADLVDRGQGTGAFARHLPAGLLSQIAYAAVFSVADSAPGRERSGPDAAVIASLLVLGVPERRARALASRDG